MKLLFITGFRGPTADPYYSLLYEPIAALGHQVHELGNAFTAVRYDIVHVHHIDAWNRPYTRLQQYPYSLSAAMMFVCQYLQLLLLKLLGSKIVWTMHNLYPHDSKHPRVDRIFSLICIGLLDGWISLSESQKQIAIEEFPVLAAKTNCVSVSPHYRSAYPPALAKSAARAQLGLAEKQTVILFVGWLRLYKGVDSLMKTFHNLKGDSVSLVVAGAPLPKSFAQFLEKLAAADDRILYMPEHQSPESVAILFSAADVAVFPYRKFLNSGAPLLSLSFRVPCLVRDTPPMIDLQKAVGPEWVRLFDGEFGLQSLQDAISWSTNPRDAGTPDLAMFEPDLAAQHAIRLYKDVLST